MTGSRDTQSSDRHVACNFLQLIIASVLSFDCQRRLAESSELILAGCAVLCCWCMWEQSSSLCAWARCDFFWCWLKTRYLALRYRQWQSRLKLLRVCKQNPIFACLPIHDMSLIFTAAALLSASGASSASNINLLWLWWPLQWIPLWFH